MQPLAGLKIGLLTASASRLGGGVFEAVATQAAIIRSLGGEAPVFALNDQYAAEDSARFAAGSLTTLETAGPRQIGFAPSLVDALLAANLDCLHLHGIWMYPSRAATRWASATGNAYVISPHGMLDPWITRRGRWKKALARTGYERASWQRATLLHALTAAEAGDITREAGRSDSAIIPNAAPPVSSGEIAERPPHVVYIGRIHPKKNLTALIEGWTRAALDPQCRLTIAGWGDPADVAQLRAQLVQAPPSIAFVGPVYGAAKQALLETARFIVLPSLSEGLPMAVLEGWAAGTPAILTGECNLPEGLAAGAALDCGYDSASIAARLEHALGMGHAQWQAMALAARGLAAGPFSPGVIAARWAQVYGQAVALRRGYA